MTTHHLQLFSEYGEIRPRLTCTATPDAPCRRRPVDPDLESWTDEDETTPGHECWAVEWVEDAGWESVATETNGTLFSVDVQVYYDDGPVIATVSPVADGGVSAEPSDTEVQAAGEAVYATATRFIPPTCDLGSYWTDLARAALVAAREVSRHD